LETRKLKLVGIRNKREDYHLLYYINYLKAGLKVGLISTVKILVDDIEYKATHTTPDSITPLIITAEMREMQVLNIVLWK
jgi:UDP-N-acetylmuramoyl-L-alanyl-D-glutamate--2,6-diaminopimelate ligase